MQAGPLISDHFLGILGLYVGVAGLLVGFIGIYLAQKSDKKSKTAQQARRAAEQRLLRYMATRSLEALTESAMNIMQKIRGREWGNVAESAESLGQLVGEARGAWSPLLEPLEKDKLDAASTEIRTFIDSIPMSAPDFQPTEEVIQLMLARCRRLVEVSTETAGRLSVELMQQPEE